MELPAHFCFTQTNTPVFALEKFFRQSVKSKCWIKRDDLTGLELSGNKVRKLDFLIKDAIMQNCERIITCGGIQSNHCRTTAFYAAKLGLKTTLILKGEKPKDLQGNYFLNYVLETDSHFITNDDYKDVDRIMIEISKKYPEKCYIIPEGGSNHIGAWGYAKCFIEILNQFEERNEKPDTIIVATGSGGTHAGLLAAKILLKSEIDIYSVNVCDNASFFRNKINSIINSMVLESGDNIKCNEDSINIIDGYTGEGYGIISDYEVEIIKRLAQTEGIIIDPVYGAKALRGFEDNLINGNIPGDNILFIHTGGIFGLFPYWHYFLQV